MWILEFFCIILSNSLKLNFKFKNHLILQVSQQHETKTVVVEVHRSDVDENNEKSNILTKSSSASSFSSLASKSSNTSIASNSLSSAICLEIQRRMEVAKIINGITSRILTWFFSENSNQGRKTINRWAITNEKNPERNKYWPTISAQQTYGWI